MDMQGKRMITPDSERTPSLSIVVITRNTRDLLKNLLASVEGDLCLRPMIREIMVVDNGSTDGTDILVTREFPWVLLIPNRENKGFAASANMGAHRSTGEYVLFLNSDTVLIQGEVSKLVRFMEANPEVGICGPQLLYPDGRLQRSFAYTPSILFEVIPRSFLEFLCPNRYAAKRLSRQPSRSCPPSPLTSSRACPQTLISPLSHDVDSLIGAAMVVRRETLDVLKGFDERFFFFLEETDLCLRAKGLGQKVTFVPGAGVVHLQGQTVSKNWLKGRIEYNISLYKFMGKHHNTIYCVTFKAIRFLKCLLVVAFISTVPMVFLGNKARRTYHYYRGLFLWHVRGCPADGGLLVNSPVQK
jgi:GT2 family glycosyltransferase